MAVLNWWSHLSGSSRLCACNEKKRKRKRKRKGKRKRKRNERKTDYSYSRARLGNYFQLQLQACLRRRINIALHYSPTFSRKKKCNTFCANGTLQHEEKYLSNCHPKTTSWVTSTCAGYCDSAFSARATPAQNWEEDLASTLSDLKLTRGERIPVCVERSPQWRGLRGNCAWRRHPNRWRTAVELLIQMLSRKYERDQEASDRGRSRPRKERKNIESGN